MRVPSGDGSSGLSSCRLRLRPPARGSIELAVDSPDVGSMLRALNQLAPSDITDSLARLAHDMGAYDMTAFLVDFGQSTLCPIPDRGVHVDAPIGVATEGTLEGRCFLERRLVSEVTGGSTRVCVPILEGSDCTGVLAFTQSRDLDDDGRRRNEELGMLAGAAIAIAARNTDLFNLIRRRKAMSLPASIQWDLLPSLHLKTPEATSSGLLEPAYDVGGDFFDHSANGFTVDVAIMDAMGHGLGSSVVSSLAVGSYRHDRREGLPLGVIHDQLDRVLARSVRRASVLSPGNSPGLMCNPVCLLDQRRPPSASPPPERSGGRLPPVSTFTSLGARGSAGRRGGGSTGAR